MFKKKASSANRRRPRKSTTRERGGMFSSESTSSRKSRKSAPKSSKRNLDDESQMLHAKIGQLEDFIAGSPFRERQKRFKTHDTVPPPEQSNSQASTRGRGRRQPSRRELESMRNERFSHLFTFVCLFAAVCAMLYWLLQLVD